MSLFHKIIPFVLEHEGGYVNDKDDPGGETKYGISKRAFPHLNILDLTQKEAIQIYYDKYWKHDWEQLGFPLAACMFDTAVNMGHSRANHFLKLCSRNHDNYLKLRADRYNELISDNPTLKKFEKGWMNRVAQLRRFIDAGNVGNFIHGGNRKDIT